MAIILEKQFQKLKDLVVNANKFYVGATDDIMGYDGPVNPTAIITYIGHVDKPPIKLLVIAENVHEGGHIPYRIYTVILDDDFELRGYDPASKKINFVSALESTDGSINGVRLAEDWRESDPIGVLNQLCHAFVTCQYAILRRHDTHSNCYE